ncbi:MAG: MaoC family dehydratase N-terminal domain-containing protein [Chrysiogenetes bacterium]|nr:MaoC family dehydratase N-terminal domain-containing protein [Chrysiogenetes bacterium]
MISGQLYFEDFESGQEFTSPPRTLGEKEFGMFADLTGDDHPIHYDLEYCKGRGLPERLSHGLLNTALTVLGASTLAPRVHESMVAFLEQSSRFVGPVYLGDTVHPKLIVEELQPQRTTGLVTLRSELTNQRGELVLEGRHVYLVKKR